MPSAPADSTEAASWHCGRSPPSPALVSHSVLLTISPFCQHGLRFLVASHSSTASSSHLRGLPFFSRVVSSTTNAVGNHTHPRYCNLQRPCVRTPLLAPLTARSCPQLPIQNRGGPSPSVCLQQPFQAAHHRHRRVPSCRGDRRGERLRLAAAAAAAAEAAIGRRRCGAQGRRGRRGQGGPAAARSADGGWRWRRGGGEAGRGEAGEKRGG